MNIRSLALWTDLMFHRYRGEVIDRGDVVVVCTPSNPTYRWGNFLLFPGPPTPADLARWEARFVAELGDLGHRVFAWDADPHDPTVPREGAARAFVAAGYRLEPGETLGADSSTLRPPPQPTEGLEVRPLDPAGDWREVIDLQVLCRDVDEDEEGYRIYRERVMERYLAMQLGGLGAWYGAYLGERLVADMGLFVWDGVGRFQHVETHPDFRRRGIAGTMIHALSRRAFEVQGAHTLVLVADPEGPAVALYKRLGYRLREVTLGLERKNSTASFRSGRSFRVR